MKEILSEIKTCRERNLELFKDLREKMSIPQDCFVMDIDHEDNVEIKENADKSQVLYVDGKEQTDKIVSKIVKGDDVNYIATKRVGIDDKKYDLTIASKLTTK